MDPRPSHLDAGTLLSLLLLRGQPGLGKEPGSGRSRPLSTSELAEESLEVAPLVGAVEAGRGQEAGDAGGALEGAIPTEEEPQLPADGDAPQAALRGTKARVEAREVERRVHGRERVRDEGAHGLAAGDGGLEATGDSGPMLCFGSARNVVVSCGSH
jgi:hypothetical protein